MQIKNKKILKLILKFTAAVTALSFLATDAPAMASVFTELSATMTRLKIGGTPDVFADHTVRFTMPTSHDFDASGSEDQILIDIPPGFSSGGVWAVSDFSLSAGGGAVNYTIDSVIQGASPQSPDCTGAAGSNKVRAAVETDTNIFRFRACTGASFAAGTGVVTVSILGNSPGGTFENPTTAGTYILGVSHDDEGVSNKNIGTIGVAILTNDQTSVAAAVDPSISFNVGATTAGCSTSFSGNGGTVTMGTVSINSVASSDTAYPGESTRPHICVRVSTNAANGYSIAVRSATNNGLVSASFPTDFIPSSSGVISNGTDRYGLCVGTGAGEKGRSATVPSGADPTAVAPYNSSSCTGTTANGESVGLVDATFRSVVSGTTVVSNGFSTFRAKVSTSNSTIGHFDYGDTLTFLATGNF